MSYIQNPRPAATQPPSVSRPVPPEPRREMEERLPAAVQPFLTWLTAKPRHHEAVAERPGWHYAAIAVAQVLSGVALGALCLGARMPLWAALLGVPLGWLLTSSGLGLLQVVVFHHCSHGTVFAAREWNILAGRLTSAMLLFKHFDIYKREHMLHHSANKLLTDEDEFADFVFGTCGLVGGVSRRRLWLRVVGHLVSPVFHARFAWRRARAAMRSPDPLHNLVALTAWAFVLGAAAYAGGLGVVLLVWVVPLTVLLQIATVFRILCEHCFPDEAIIIARGRDLPHHATSGVFPGRCPPPRRLAAAPRLAAWAWWWLEMLTWQLFVRLFVMVGDAPCHDFHHRRPGSRKWTSYIQAREDDRTRAQAASGPEYNECWGLLRAVDRTLASLATKPPGFRV